MSPWYLVALLVSLAGMVVLDLRWRLFFGRGPVRAAVTLAVGIAFLLIWDLAGVGLGVFFRGHTTLLTGITVAREVPLEEPFFLALLSYLTMNLYGAATRRPTSTRPPTREDA